MKKGLHFDRWGEQTPGTSQGWAYLNRRHGMWTASWSADVRTESVTFPSAVVDDFGSLVRVPTFILLGRAVA